MIYIHGCGHFHPENIIDNDFLENLDIGTSNEWILERVGIHQRRTVLPLDYIKETKNLNPVNAHEASLYTNAQTGALAARQAIEMAQINKDDIGMVISGGCSPQYSCPAEASCIANELEIEAVAFDLSSACSTLATQLHFINNMTAESLPDYILLVVPENNTKSINYTDRSSAVLWGDCSCALVISKTIPSKFSINHTFLKSSPKGWDKVNIPTARHFNQEGKTVQTFAIKKSLSIIKNLRSTISEDVSKEIFIGHQANKMMLNSVSKLAGISNHYYNEDKYGNCGAAGAPSVLGQKWDQFQAGDNIIFAVVGSWLTWGGALIEVR